MAEEMGFEVLHGIVDCLWVVGEPISKFKEAAERETGNIKGILVTPVNRFFLVVGKTLGGVIIDII